MVRVLKREVWDNPSIEAERRLKVVGQDHPFDDLRRVGHGFHRISFALWDGLNGGGGNDDQAGSRNKMGAGRDSEEVRWRFLFRGPIGSSDLDVGHLPMLNDDLSRAAMFPDRVACHSLEEWNPGNVRSGTIRSNNDIGE